MLTTIFWDNDGVLVDTEELYLQASREVLSGIGVELSREEFLSISLVEGRSAFDLAADRGVSPEGIRELRADRNRRYSQLLSAGVYVPDGVEETLAGLQGKLTMGIVTGSLREHFQIIHSSTGLLSYFDFILTREDYINSKPDPEPYLTAMERNGLRREECLIIEDSERGLAAAQAAGVRCIVVPNGLTVGCSFEGAYRVLASVREVVPEVDRLMMGAETCNRM